MEELATAQKRLAELRRQIAQDPPLWLDNTHQTNHIAWIMQGHWKIVS